MSEEKYYIDRTCKACGHSDRFFLTKKEKAFELYDSKKIWAASCTKCESTECLSVGGPLIELDKELLLEWCSVENLMFMQQDEDLLLADTKYLDLILDILDNCQISSYKQSVLVSALCVIVYDNLVDTKNGDMNLLKRVASELKVRRHLLENSSDMIMDYIKNVTYPYLDIEK